ncbi:hypothetical protein [Pelagicoccus sp. SDUM812005]|uniref:hypothetical protein n=1 Tax=Pelagicoccus sp. SDUM812005 TaxID=3041257 RepID=UPI00281046E0|nr:hypothetical protein [Pelagicoccus sp. SDUM812005]MDQ8180390.1 hypothetical protein [Pelagicoccus sp. SDUM812005]
MKELIESVGKRSEPITVFLIMIEPGCGTLYEPTKNVRKAEAAGKDYGDDCGIPSLRASYKR